MSRQPSEGMDDDRGIVGLAPVRRGPIIVRHGRDVEAFDGMDDGDGEDFQRIQLAVIWGAIVRHRLKIAATILCALIVGFAATLLMQKQYTATAVLQIDREAAKVVDVDGLTPTEATTGNEFIATQVGLLKSDALARRVAQTLRLQQNAVFRDMAGLDPVKQGEQTRDPANVEDRLARVVAGTLRVRQQGLSRLVSVEVTTPDPALSASIANAVSENFQTISMERRFESSAYARRFLQEQLAKAKERLETSERELVAYGAAEQIITVAPTGGQASGGDTATQSLTAANLASLNAMLTAAQGRRITAEQKWRQAQGASPLSLPEVQSSPAIQSLLQERARLSANYEEKARVFGPAMPEMQQLKAQIEEVERQLRSQSESVLGTIRAEYTRAQQEENRLAAQVEGLKGSYIDLRERNINNTILQREVDTNRALYEGLLQRYKDVGVAGGVTSNNISVVDRATTPNGPSSPKLLLNLAVALVLGAGVAAALVFLLETMDELVRNPDDVQSKLGYSVLGVIPILEAGTSPREAMGLARSSFSEAYASARTALQFSTVDGAPRNVLITSARPSEGKSTTALALATSFARLGVRTLLVDGDLRNPSVHRLVAVNNATGLSNYLTGAPWEESVRPTDQSDLFVLPTGPLPPNPAELLSSPRFARLLEDAGQHFSVVIVDGPPVIGLADAPILSSYTDGTVVVVEANVARRSVVRIAVRRLLQARARLSGVILTKFNSTSAGYGYGYGYAYAYSYDYGQKTPMIAEDSGR
ncbi:MAG TPA: polysaccharide biosynthesis tyrosine autokinase [Caulobacter sp.]|nr:polysaccharide biosynthesis tyrosine autokinase [Caulobacter sp.]